jgi:hypothetical protein
MQRRVFFSGLLSAALMAGAAMASDFQASVLAQLRAQGFSDIQVETTWLGRLKITAQRRGAGREIVLNPRTGEILRDILSTRDGSVQPRISDDRDDGPEHAGADHPASGGSASKDQPEQKASETSSHSSDSHDSESHDSESHDSKSGEKDD